MIISVTAVKMVTVVVMAVLVMGWMCDSDWHLSSTYHASSPGPHTDGLKHGHQALLTSFFLLSCVPKEGLEIMIISVPISCGFS